MRSITPVAKPPAFLYYFLLLNLRCTSGSALSVRVRVIIADGVKSSKEDVSFCFISSIFINSM